MQVIETVAKFVLQWCAEKHAVLSLIVYASTSSVPVLSLRKRDSGGAHSVFKQQLIADSSKWLGQLITTEVGTAHNCYIAEYHNSVKEMELLGIFHG